MATIPRGLRHVPTDELVAELSARGALRRYEQQEYVPGIVIARASQSRGQVLDYAAGRCVHGLITTMYQNRVVAVEERAPNDPDAGPNDVVIAASVVTLNPDYEEPSDG